METTKHSPKGWGQELVDALNQSVREKHKEPTRKDVLAKELDKKDKK